MITHKSAILTSISMAVLSATLSLVATTNNAQPTEQNGAPAGPDATAWHRPRTPVSIDTNGDGYVSEHEANTWYQATFSALDTNGDSVLSREEFLAGHMGAGPGTGPRAAQRQAGRASLFDDMDANEDGVISLPEFLLWHDVQYRDAYATHYGKVSVEVFRAAMHQ